MNYIKIFCFIFAFFLGVELVLKFKDPSIYTYDQKLGWRTKSDFNHTYNQKDLYSNTYKAHYSTDEYGARTFSSHGNIASSLDKINIIAIGDSFTMGPYVGNDQMWFSVLAKKIKKIGYQSKVSAFGAGAYGNFQQYLLLKKIIKEGYSNSQGYEYPDIFVMQFCDNDFSNNNFEIEKASFSLSQYMRRPYLVDDKIYYHKSFFSPLFATSTPYLRNSRLFAKLIFIYELILRKYIFSNNQPIKRKLITEAQKTTLKILTNIRNIYPHSPSFIFSCSNRLTQINSDWKKLARLAGFTVLDETSNFIDQARKEGKKIFYKDGGHLNQLGNSYLGELVFKEITTKYIIFN